MSEKQKKIFAVDIKRATTVGLPTGGSTVAEVGDVLVVPNDVSADDAAYLCAMGKAAPCDPKLKAERARQKTATRKESDKKDQDKE